MSESVRQASWIMALALALGVGGGVLLAARIGLQPHELVEFYGRGPIIGAELRF